MNHKFLFEREGFDFYQVGMMYWACEAYNEFGDQKIIAKDYSLSKLFDKLGIK